jgi:hypothetical protein
MLDRIKKEPACGGCADFERLDLTRAECRFIGLYRSLSEQERGQLRRLFEVLATNPKESANS